MMVCCQSGVRGSHSVGKGCQNGEMKECQSDGKPCHDSVKGVSQSDEKLCHTAEKICQTGVRV